MKTLCGSARQIRHGAEVAGNQHGFDTSHVVNFRLASRAIQLSMPRMPDIAEGDEVVVVGDFVNGTLVGRAYRNLSAGTYDRVAKRSLLFMVFFYGILALLLAFPLHFLGSLPGNHAFLMGLVCRIYWTVVLLLVLRAVLNEMKSRWAYCRVRWGLFSLQAARA
jgi:DNA-directed RNA polymerase subunit K/omega